MEEALSILWTYARRQPIESNGKTIVATISQSIAAIRLIMRLERWLQKNEESKSEARKMMSEARKTKPSKNLELEHVSEKPVAPSGKVTTPTYTPQPLSLPYHNVHARVAKVSYTMSKARKPYHISLRVQVAGLSIQTTCNQQKKQRRNAACKAKERKSISPYETSCVVGHKHSKAAALMPDKNRIRPPCMGLIISGINH